MKRWMVVLLIVIVLLVAGAIMYENGTFEAMGWQNLVIIFAAIMGPIKFLANSFSNPTENLKIVQARDEYNQLKADQEQERKKLDEEIKRKEDQVRVLDKEVELIDAKLAHLEERRKNIYVEPQNRSMDDANARLENLLK